jgi:hypothetical protein
MENPVNQSCFQLGVAPLESHIALDVKAGNDAKIFFHPGRSPFTRVLQSRLSYSVLGYGVGGTYHLRQVSKRINSARARRLRKLWVNTGIRPD